MAETPLDVKPNEQDMSKGVGILFIVLALVLLGWLCWLFCPICSTCLSCKEPASCDTSFFEVLETYPNKCPHQEPESQPPPINQADGKGNTTPNQLQVPVVCHVIPKVEGIQNHENRDIDSVFEPDPVASTTNYTTQDLDIPSDQDPSTSAANLPLDESTAPEGCSELCAQDVIPAPLHSVTHNSLPSLPATINQSLPTSPDTNNNSSTLPDIGHRFPFLPDLSEISEYPESQEYKLTYLPTIPEHPLITSNTTRTMSNEVIMNPSHLPELTQPSTSSMPDLAPSTSFSPYYPPRDGSRLLFYRNTNIDVSDIQSSNPELNGNLSSIDSYESLGSIDHPEKKVVVDLHCHDDTAKEE